MHTYLHLGLFFLKCCVRNTSFSRGMTMSCSRTVTCLSRSLPTIRIPLNLLCIRQFHISHNVYRGPDVLKDLRHRAGNFSLSLFLSPESKSNFLSFSSSQPQKNENSQKKKKDKRQK